MNESYTPHPAVVRVVVPERDGLSLGTGTLVDVRGSYALVVSNWHVVRDATGQLHVIFPDGFRSTAYVLKVDRDWDLAALAVWRPNIAPVQVARSVPRAGDRLTIAGYGDGSYRAAQGACGAQYLAPGVGMPHDIIELSAEARQGDSGGPIFNQQGELAGVLFGSAQGMTSGSHALRLRWFLQSIVPDKELGHWDPTAVAQASPAAVMQPNTTTVAAANPLEPRAAPAQTFDVPIGGATATSTMSSVGPTTSVAGTLVSSGDNAAILPTAIPADGYPHQPHDLSDAGGDAGFDWRVFVGTSAIEQIKAALALVGLLVLVERGLQWLVSSAQAPAKAKKLPAMPSDG
ncbi:MAG: trypsin-like peptidase domain-containing protein [Planctomycetes bacterium]|nr:trypsin-like peptidase domain-containing protein [Planctomycetota bacterium]